MGKFEKGIALFFALLNLSFAQGPPRPFFSLEVKKNVDVLRLFPLEVGAQWIYENVREEAIGKENLIVKATWECTIKVAAHIKTPDGIIVKRTSSIRNVHYELPADIPQESLELFKKSVETSYIPNYFIRGNYVFEVYIGMQSGNRGSSTAASSRDWDNQCPSFFFPMTRGLRWSEHARESIDFKQDQLFRQGKGGAPNPGMYNWVVEDQMDLELPAGKIEGVYQLIYRTNGGPTMVWFKEGVGMVKTSFFHSGSYWQQTSLLKKSIITKRHQRNL